METFSEFIFSDGLKLGLAVLLGGVIGLEREASDKPAGLRTNILICVGSALMMILSIRVAQQFATTVADPGRIAQGVITGIGFLGAGTILHSRGGVTGLTTAATTWAVSGVGLVLGSGFFLLGIMSTLLILVVLWLLAKIEKALPNGKGKHTLLRVVSEEPVGHLDAVRILLEREGISPAGWNYRRLRDGHCVVVDCSLPGKQLPRLISQVAALPGIRSARKL